MRPTLETLGLEPPPIPYELEGNISLWFVEVIGRIDSLLVNLVGNLIFTRVHHFAPDFPFTPIFERFSDDAAVRTAEETAQAVVAGVVAQLRLWITRRAPRA
jgi:hypothetical protein